MSLTQEQAQKRVKALVAHHTRFPAEKLESRSDLFADVGVDGTDAEDLLVDFCRRFAVDPATIHFDRHFGPELAFNPFALLRPSWWKWQRERIPVTIDVLTQAAMTGVWPFDYGDKAPSS